MSIYESLLKSLNEAVEYEEGRIPLRSNQMTIADPEEFSSVDIKSIRHESGLSQAAFAAAMGVSKKTVEAWECGRNKPAGTAKRLLAFVEEDPHFFEKNNIVEFGEVAETKQSFVRAAAKSEKTIVVTIGARPNYLFRAAFAEGQV